MALALGLDFQKDVRVMLAEALLSVCLEQPARERERKGRVRKTKNKWRR